MRMNVVNHPNSRRLYVSRLSIAAAFALALAGCSRGGSEAEQNVTAAEPAGTTVEIPETVAPPVIPSEPAEPAPAENVTEEQLSEEAQMQEDADATGMTSRLPVPGESAPAVTE